MNIRLYQVCSCHIPLDRIFGRGGTVCRSPRVPGQARFFAMPQGPPPACCSMPWGMKFHSPTTWGALRILVPPEYLARAIFTRRPPALCSVPRGPKFHSASTPGNWPDSGSPQIPGQSSFFWDTTGAPSSALLHASWQQILVCQHVGH